MQKSGLVYKKMSRNLDRLKNDTFPKQPFTAQEIIRDFQHKEIMIRFGYNLSGNDRFYINTVHIPDEYSFSIFASIQSIKLMGEVIATNKRNFLLDGTFKVVPRSEFYQLLIISIEYKSDVIYFSLFSQID